MRERAPTAPREGPDDRAVETQQLRGARDRAAAPRRGFEYLDPDGERIDDPEVLERIAALAIPPAWREVWICMDPLGHLQATGLDAAGRKQYLYHAVGAPTATGTSSTRCSPSGRRCRGCAAAWRAT